MAQEGHRLVKVAIDRRAEIRRPLVVKPPKSGKKRESESQEG